jgi:MFS transporter, SP family, sugar:H+ symporter
MLTIPIRLWNFLIAFFTPFIVSAIDFRYGYVFAGCNVIAALIIYFFVIEGQGRTLEEIDTMYLQGVLPWKSSKWVAPPPEEIERIRQEAGTHDGPVDDDQAPKDSQESGDAPGEKVEDAAQQESSGEPANKETV